MEPKFEAFPPPPPAPIPQQRSSNAASPKSLLASLRNGAVAAGVAALKFGILAFKSLQTSLSLFLMIWVYSWIFGWPFAIGFVLLIFVHEMGHVLAAKLLGLPVTLPMFIPFVGAYVVMKETPRDAWTEALFAMGGPLAGGVAAWIVLWAGFYLHLPWVIAVASATFVINIINMIPVPPLDGGRMCAAISPWFWFIGLLLLGVVLIFFHSFTTSILIIAIVFFMTLPRLKETFFGEPTEDMQAYYATHISNRLTMALFYLGILAGLVLGYGHASGYLTPLLEVQPGQ